MGLLTDSKQLREQLLSKNLYNPDNVYDLKSDVVTRTLDTLQSVGFDPRSSFVPSLVENLVDNTPLVQIGYKRLAIEFARKAVDNASNQIQIDITAPFDKNPDSKLISRKEDWTITPSENEKKLNFKNLGDKLFGVHDKSNLLDRHDNELQYNSEAFFTNTGAKQKEELLKNLSKNTYSKYSNNLEEIIKNTIPDFTNSSSFREKRKFDYDSSIEFDKNGYLINDNGYTSESNRKSSKPINGNTEVTDLGKTLIDRNLQKDILIGEGFGETNIKDKTSVKLANGGELYRDIYDDQLDDTFTYGNGKEDAKRFNIKRGLLYYTTQLAKSGNQVGENIKSDNTVFNVAENDTKTYKTNKYRNFTISNQYDNYSKTLRFKGNGNPDSVLKDNVFGKIYPKTKGGTVKDNRVYMFSIENLTYNASEWSALPECEQGNNGGRLMWFAPYGISINENSISNTDAEKFIGRIEPLYTYAGSERKAQIEFNLIIDKPPNLNDYNISDLDKYFLGEQVGLKTTVPSKPDSSTLPEKIVDNTTEAKAISDISFYFDNNLYDVSETLNSGYEMSDSGRTINDNKNLIGLNKEFSTQIIDLIKFMQTDDSNLFEIEIKGYASDLSTLDYNTGLSFRRANRLMNYVIEQYNADGNSKDKLTFDNTNPSEMYLDYTSKNIGKKLSFKSTATNKPLLFSINAYSDSKSNPIGKDIKEVDNPIVKEDRRCTISFIRRTDVKNNTVLQSKEVNPTVGDLNDSNAVKNGVDGNNANSNELSTRPCNDPFEKHRGEDDGKVPLGNNKANYYTPSYNSQSPLDFHNRLTFLQQLTRPGSSLEKTVGVNSIFGKQPSQILRIGDFYHTKIIVNSISYSYADAPWDMNPEGMGMQPMMAKITMDVNVIGGQSMKFAIDQLQNAISKNYYANSTFVGKKDLQLKDGGTTIDMSRFYNPSSDALNSEELQGELNADRKKERKNN